MKLLKVQNFTLVLPHQTRPIFENISLDLGQKEKVALVGPSGSGKTLFLRSVCLLEEGLRGEIQWNGEAIFPEKIPYYRSKMIYVGQRSYLPYGKVENSFSELFNLKMNRGKRWYRDQTEAALKFLGRPSDFLEKRTEVLSGGEKQIVHILRALALEPDFLCLDEPTSALDSTTALRVEDWLNAHFKGSWIWVTHHDEQVKRVSSRVIQLSTLC